ncbi:hypothetical protein IC762_08530 [Bradyrhizobium genosp. L]|uniref:hypothetical protein n=1 Tax=Bradyrhizobium genosp. L TaxID=83637 RepID=UPI0018A316D3|nr:hypothetical protein [Bradyrhizobium genosp. L]QPF86314.1 hypothetical protein IC762_08530 [Bradyrhizobium genosp. L]
MSNLRFGLLALGLFALIFIGGSWARRGFPVMTYGIVSLKPDPRLPTFEQAVKEGERKDWVNSKTNQGDGNPQRDRLRRELLQAATAYKLSPCGSTTRQNFIEALSNYTQAWADMAFCTPGVDGCPGNVDARFDATVAAFTTPADANVKSALREAIAIGGISREDFPNSVRRHVFSWTGAPPTEPTEACLIARKQASRQ